MSTLALSIITASFVLACAINPRVGGWLFLMAACLICLVLMANEFGLIF